MPYKGIKGEQEYSSTHS